MDFSTIPFLSILVFLPLLGAIFVALIDHNVSVKNARQVGLWVTSATLFLAIVISLMSGASKESGGFIFSERFMITEALGLEYHLGVDALSLGFALLTTGFFPIIMLASWEYDIRELKFFIFLLLVLETLILGSLCSLNLLVFYIFFESVLVPVYFLSNFKKEQFQEDLGMKNVLYTLLGSIFLLVAMLKIYELLGTFSFVDILQKPLSVRMQLFLFSGFMFSFLMKIPVFPFHAWLAHTYSNTYAPVSMLLSGAIAKLGVYAILRFNFALFQDAILILGPYLKWFFLVGFLYIMVGLYSQRHVNRLFAHLDLSHTALALFCIFLLKKKLIVIGVYHIFVTAVTIPGVYYIASTVTRRLNTDRIKFFGGIASVMPHFSVLFFLGCYFLACLPGSPFFASFVQMLFAGFSFPFPFEILVLLSGIVFAITLFWLYRRTAFGIVSEAMIRSLEDLKRGEVTLSYFFICLILFTGLCPGFLLGAVQRISESIFHSMRVGIS